MKGLILKKAFGILMLFSVLCFNLVSFAQSASSSTQAENSQLKQTVKTHNTNQSKTKMFDSGSGCMACHQN